MATEAELAYAAGLVDGEGCLDVYVSNRNRGMSPRVRIEMTHRDSIIWLHSIFGGQKPLTTHRPNSNHSSTARWTIQGDAALKFVSALRPYLKAKATEADIFARFSDWICGSGKPIDDETLAKRMEIRLALRAEKKKGKGRIKKKEFFTWQKRIQGSLQ